MEIPSCHDVFPGTIQLEPVARLTDDPLPLDECTVFVPHLDPEKLTMDYFNVSGGRLPLENMRRTFKASRNPSTPLDEKKLDWHHHVFTRLTLPWNGAADNSDTRMAFRSGNTFLVKKFFTFGRRTVQPFEFHILQTAEAPLLCYFPRLEGSMEPERSFHHQRENFYQRYVLQPDCIYRFGPGTTYILLTVVQTRFSLDRVSLEVADCLETLWGVADPTTHLDLTGWTVAKKSLKRKRSPVKRASPILPKPPVCTAPPVTLDPPPESAADFLNNFCASLNEPSPEHITEPECILEDLSETIDAFVEKYGSNVSTGWEDVVMELFQ